MKLNWTSYSIVNPELPCATVGQQEKLLRSRGNSGHSDNPWKHADGAFNATSFKQKIQSLLFKIGYWKQQNPV